MPQARRLAPRSTWEPCALKCSVCQEGKAWVLQSGVTVGMLGWLTVQRGEGFRDHQRATTSRSFPSFCSGKGVGHLPLPCGTTGERHGLGSDQATTPVTRDVHGESLHFPKLLRLTASSLYYDKDCVVTRTVPGTLTVLGEF